MAVGAGSMAGVRAQAISGILQRSSGSIVWTIHLTDPVGSVQCPGTVSRAVPSKGRHPAATVIRAERLEPSDASVGVGCTARPPG